MGGRVLVGCETSGVVRRAFEAVGVEAWSCDLLESEDGSARHVVGDVRAVVRDLGPWALAVFHPPCTRLASSGARWMAGREAEINAALELVRWMLAYQHAVPRVCVENPVGLIGTRVRPADQLVHPWQHGHGETKTTCLWLRNLPLLRQTKIVAGRDDRLHRLPPSPDRWKVRSRTYEGIAKAMASQWGPLVGS